jgi:cobalt/nickel transport system ATP-binding protein
MGDYTDRVSHHLSIGEKKRIAIATVLSIGPEILVLDEPTSGLDPRARRNLITLFREMDIAMLVSAHDMGFVSELLPITAIMVEGKIVAQGQTSAILGDKALQANTALKRHNPQ